MNGKKKGSAPEVPEATTRLLYCSFCGKNQHEVSRLIAGPNVFICDECVDVCNDVIDEADGEHSGVSQVNLEMQLGTSSTCLYEVASDLQRLRKHVKQWSRTLREQQRQLQNAGIRKSRLVGDVVLRRVKSGEWDRTILRQIMDESLDAPEERALFGLPAKKSA